MSRYLVPIFLSAILIAVLVGVNRGFNSLSDYFHADFAPGFVVGGVFVGALVAFIMWIDPASRPRGAGPAADQKHNRGPLD